MQSFDDTVTSAELTRCLVQLPAILGWGLVPAALALVVFRSRQGPVRVGLLTSAATLLLVLGGGVVAALLGWSPSLTGLDRWLVTVGYGVSLVLTVGFSLSAFVLAAANRSCRALLRPALLGLLAFGLAHFVYPVSVGAYCDYANSQRTDACRWVEQGGCIFLLDRSQGHDSGFAGLIEVYPPCFSLPRS